MHCTRREALSLLLAAPAMIRGGRAAATPTAATLDEVLAAAVAGGVPGVALQVEAAGETRYAGVAGVASLERDTPLTATDRFRIYSIAKTFTAIIALQLADDGTLTLADTVPQWLNDPVVANIPNIEQITIRQLLTHTSGIYDYAGDMSNPFFADAFLGPEADWTRVWTPLEALAYADGARQDPYFSPGEGVYYANTNYILLGLIIEAATGRTFGEELVDRILTPLGLEQTTLETGGALPEDVVDGYQLLDGEVINVSAINLSWAWAAGGIVSTIADLARFAAAVFSGELISPAAHVEMFTFLPESWGKYHFGMGVYRIDSPNGRLIGMDGGGAGGNSSMLRLEDTDLTVVVLTNYDPGGVSALTDEAIAWALAQP